MDNLEFLIDDTGVGVASLNMPGRTFNVFSEHMIDDLETLVKIIETDSGILTGVVIISTKSAFMVGADLAMVQGYTTLRHRAKPSGIRRSFSRLSSILRRLERVTVPTVAAINGLALGGGLELAMACHHRIVAAQDVSCLGLPEVRLGLLPGAGGTQRLPRLTNPAFAAHMLLSGQAITPHTALEAGLVDQVVEGERLLNAAKTLVRQVEAGARWDLPDWQLPVDVEAVLVGEQAYEHLCSLGWVGDGVSHLYPAFGSIAHCLLDGFNKPFDDAIDVEIDNFLSLMLDPVAGNMVQTSFLSKTAASKRAVQILGQCESLPRSIAVRGELPVPARLVQKFELIDDTSAADVVFQIGRLNSTNDTDSIGLRSLPSGMATPCSTELRYVGSFDNCLSVEIAASPGGLGATALAVVNRLHMLPIVVQPDSPGPSERLLGVINDWCKQQADNDETRASLSAALDLRGLFEAADLTVGDVKSFDASHRESGLRLLMEVALEAANCIDEGLLTKPADMDVLAVTGLGFPEWTGGPLCFLDNARRGDVIGIASTSGSASYYPG